MLECMSRCLTDLKMLCAFHSIRSHEWSRVDGLRTQRGFLEEEQASTGIGPGTCA